MTEEDVKRIRKAAAESLCAEFNALLDVIESGVPLTKDIIKRVPEIRRRIATFEEILAAPELTPDQQGELNRDEELRKHYRRSQPSGCCEPSA